MPVNMKPTVYYDKFLSYYNEHPEKAVLAGGKGDFSGYGDFISIYDSVELFFHNKAIETHDRVAIITSNVINNCLLALPILDNATLVPIDSDQNEEKFKYFYNLMGVSYILTDDEMHPACLVAQNNGVGVILFKIDGGLNKRFCTLKLLFPRTRSIDDLLQDSNIAYVNMTSGTTSTPKIVPKRYDEYIPFLKRKITYFEYSSKDTELVITKAFKSTSINTMLLIIYAGGSVVMPGGFKHNKLHELIINNKVTSFIATPAVLSSYAKYAMEKRVDFTGSSLRFIRASGAPLPKKMKEYFEELFQTSVVQSYGMTETNNITCTYQEPNGYKEGSAGKSTGLDIKIMNGEILVKGYSVFKGYENKEIDNNEYFTDNWFHTGDMGYLDEDGYIFITGRIKEMINRGGEKISPYEVEKTIISHSGIADVAVFPYPNEYGSENAGAVIVCKDKNEINLIELRQYLFGKLSSYKMPTKLFVVDEIPKSANNKVQRKKLYNQLIELYPEQNNVSNKDSKIKLSDTERRLIRIWRKSLNIRTIDPEIAYVDLGGDSLNGAVVLSNIESTFRVKVPVELLFEQGTLRRVAEYIDFEKGKSNKFRFLVPVKLSGNKKPLICAHSGIGDATTYRHIGKNMEQDRPVYALRFDMKSEKWPQPLSFDFLARKYAEEIKQLDPDGPYNICGNCWGGVLAFKIASVLKEDGCNIGMLAMFDSASKDKDEYSEKVSNRLIKKMSKLFVESIDQLKNRRFGEKIRLILRKTKSIFLVIRLSVTKKVYRYAQKKNIRTLMNLTGKTGALGDAYQKYIPVKYDGVVHYFKATKGNSVKSHRQDYWRDKATEFKINIIECHHKDILTGDYAKELVRKMSIIMEKSDV